MAAGGSGRPQTDSQTDDLTCPLCLEVFTSPKALVPCLHTFCEACLQRLVDRHPGGPFPCPSCREVIQVPPGGVSAFKTNIYIKPEDLEKARKGLYCDVHPKREIELYCVNCNSCICLMCKFTDHESHKTEGLQNEEEVRTQLSNARKRLHTAIEDITVGVEKRSEDITTLQTKKQAMERGICSRHATVVVAADRIRDAALESLNLVTDKIKTKLNSEIDGMRQNMNRVRDLQKHAETSETSTSVKEIHKVAREMKDGSGSEAVVKKLIPRPMATVSRPVVQTKDTEKQMVEGMKAFMGHIARVDRELKEREVTVKEHVHCQVIQGSACRVFYLCPLDDESVWLSFESSDLSSEAQNPTKMSKDGSTLFTVTDKVGEICFKLMDGVAFRTVPSDSSFVTYAKSSKCIKLANRLNGTADIMRSIKSKSVRESTINCGKHRACDTDDNENYFVVVENAQPPNTQRKVLLFQRAHPDAINTYTPPCEPFQPSDVCFFTLGGEEVLLIADECDAIHVVGVSNGYLEFLRYLAPGFPDLLQPTAINTDTRGRLWVACSGGAILICEQAGVIQTNSDDDDDASGTADTDSDSSSEYWVEITKSV